MSLIKYTFINKKTEKTMTLKAFSEKSAKELLALVVDNLDDWELKDNN